ncbi:hypothetical protein HYH03_013337 [Edaphochlamys debaryana]|uniref:DUF7605 domain-containing protein n=1 Tax=Edaphochlamys debaryana TaxID=47281 RepID=A0A835XTM7_9CHLO|nr:hypothetical protein HYH03_013337 [Edaphochlamys debaryana]|eukprot:KAG2488031.1 hypothetical protein HYH03_013337 [Edaphochlamys debaryana]
MRLFSIGSGPGSLADGSNFDTLAISSQAFVIAAEGKPRALSIELARGGTTARATLLARNVAAWKRGGDGAITRLRLAVGVELQVGDELILASARIIAPPEDARLAFIVTDDSNGDAGPEGGHEQAVSRPPAPLGAMDVDQPSTHERPGPNHEQPLSGQTAQQLLTSALPSAPAAAAPPSPIRQPSPPPPERTPLPRTASDIREGRAPLIKGEPLEAPTGILAGTQLPSALGSVPKPKPTPSPAVAPTPAPAPKPTPAQADHTPAPGTALTPKPEPGLTPAVGPTPAAGIKTETVPAATPATGPASAAPKSAAKGPGALMEDVREVLQGMGAVLKLQGASSGAGQGSSDVGPAGVGGAEASAVKDEDDPSGLAAPKLAGPEMLSQWQGEWSDLLGKCSNPKALIGFLGGTGAGKSSLINGLLGEENIVPTNGMRASTACVILVEYSEDRAYEAAIECLTQEEWAAQRLQALEDMRGEDGLVGIISGEGGADEATAHNNARAAQDTLEAVYGRDVVRSLGGLPVEACVSRLQGVANEVTRLLGTTVRIRETKKAVFRSAVGRYVDSSNQAGTAQAWPVIKQARVAHNWPLLAGGAVLVDLPGVHDANSARGAVAKTYTDKLSRYMVVADINRAVDDKTARDLLGTEFRRQLVMHGKKDAISFVATKTDNIQHGATERELTPEVLCILAGISRHDFKQAKSKLRSARDKTYRLSGAKRGAEAKSKTAARQLERLYRDARCIRRRVGELCEAEGRELPAELGQLMEGVPDAGADYDAEEEHEEEEEHEDGEQGEDVGGPHDDEEEEEDAEDGVRPSPAKGAGDKRKRAAAEDDEELPLSKRATKVAGMETVQELMHELAQLAEDLRKACARHARLKKEAEEAAADHALAAQQVPPLLLRVRSICAAARNAYVKKRLQQDYLEGMVEVAKAAGGDKATAVKFADKGAALPVFCVSTRDALTLEGRVRSEDRASTFERVAQTELPLLREHIRSVATAAREKAQSEVAGQVLKWGNSAGRALLSQRVEGSADAADAMRAACGVQLQVLERTLVGILDEQLGSLRYELLTEGLCPSLEAGGELATQLAPGKASGWYGSMHWATYNAAIRRDGDYQSRPRGHIDWNGDLAGPILDRITLCWDELFNSRLGEALESAKVQLLGVVDTFCTAVIGAAERGGLECRPVMELCLQVLQDAERLLDSRLGPLSTQVAETARELSGDVVKPAVKGMLRPTYYACNQDCGSGVTARRRAMLESAVKELATTGQFKAAAGILERKVRLLLDHIDKALRKALPDLVRAARTRLALLWDEAPASYAQRYRAAAALRDLLEKLRAACDRAKHTLPGHTFELPAPPAAVPQAAAAEAAAGEGAGAGGPEAAAQAPGSGGASESGRAGERLQDGGGAGVLPEEGMPGPRFAAAAAMGLVQQRPWPGCDGAAAGSAAGADMEAAAVVVKAALARYAAIKAEEGPATAVGMELDPEPGPLGLGQLGPGPMGLGSLGLGPMEVGPMMGLGSLGMGPGSLGMGLMGPGPLGMGPLGMGTGSLGLGSMGPHPGPLAMGPLEVGPMGLGSLGPGLVGLGPLESGALGMGSMGVGPQGFGPMGMGPLDRL